LGQIVSKVCPFVKKYGIIIKTKGRQK